MDTGRRLESGDLDEGHPRAIDDESATGRLAGGFERTDDRAFGWIAVQDEGRGARLPDPLQHWLERAASDAGDSSGENEVESEVRTARHQIGDRADRVARCARHEVVVVDDQDDLGSRRTRRLIGDRARPQKRIELAEADLALSETACQVLAQLPARIAQP